MSNKFRNILSLAGIMLFWLLLCPKLAAFDPVETSFQTRYQFELYQSWLKKGNFKTHFPAAFTQEKVVKTFIDYDDRPLMVEYDWENFQITSQREVVGFLFSAGDTGRIWSLIKYIEGFIYRLNSANKQFLLDYVDFSELQIQYSGLSAEAALDRLWNDFDYRRARFHPIKIEQNAASIFFILNPLSGNQLKLGFSLDFDSQKEMEKIIIFEKEISANTDLEEYSPNLPESSEHKDQSIISEKTKKADSDELISAYIPPAKTDVEKADLQKPKLSEKDFADLLKTDKLRLADYIQHTINQKQTRELLNNKITNPLAFLQKEFPEWEISLQNGFYLISQPPLSNEFHCDLKLKVENRKDGIDILPIDDDYYFLGKYMIFSGKEKIDLRGLSDDEISRIAPFIPQLIYEHRSLGSRLLNFLLINDNVPTTLIVHNEERKKYELDSYANLLLLLNNFWQKRTVYFSILNVKKVNGFIEFHSFLIAYNAESQVSDIADIKFHLDGDYRIDLIMMVLHPDAELPGN